MCGINGLVNRHLSKETAEGHLNAMNKLIQHRGPDSQDIFYDSGIGLGHARLSILDLSDIANQPMISFSGRFVSVTIIVFIFKELEIILKIFTISCVCFKFMHFVPLSFQRYAIASNLKIVTPFVIKFIIILINLNKTFGFLKLRSI